jgi:hypothetical protein
MPATKRKVQQTNTQMPPPTRPELPPVLDMSSSAKQVKTSRADKSWLLFTGKAQRVSVGEFPLPWVVT